jgi:tripartite ATP-independent transporter DctM subunit
MAETIPPSIILIAIGASTGVSIAALFTGGLLPAAVGALALALLIYFRSHREPKPDVPSPNMRIVGSTFVAAIPALILPLLIRSSVIEGVATATEVSTVGIVYSILCGVLIYREFPLRKIYPSLVATASVSGAIMFIIGMATVMAWALTQSGFSNLLESAMIQVTGGKFGFIVVSIVAFAILGSVLEGVPAIVLFGPLFFPIAKEMGIHEVHYAMITILSMSLGLFAPPFGVGFYGACAIAQIEPDKAMRNIWAYLLALVGALVFIAAFPWLSIGFIHTR